MLLECYQRLGYVPKPTDVPAVVLDDVRGKLDLAEPSIRTVVQSKDNPADLINVALDELVRQSCELPGYTTLDAVTASIEHEAYGGTDEGNRRDGSGRGSSRDHTRRAARADAGDQRRRR